MDRQVPLTQIPPLSPEDRAWLDGQLRRYASMLTYLQEH